MVAHIIAHGGNSRAAARRDLLDALRDQAAGGADIEIPGDGARRARALLQAHAARRIVQIKRRLARRHLTDADMLVSAVRPFLKFNAAELYIRTNSRDAKFSLQQIH